MLDRNWRSRQGEIDLVAERDGVVVFCEVKTRVGSCYGEPFEAVTRAKQTRLRKLAAEWLRTRRAEGAPGVRRRPYEVRFDVVSVFGARLDVIEGAF